MNKWWIIWAIVVFLLICLICDGCSYPVRTTDEKFIKKYQNFDYCRIDVEKQNETYSCGIACLTSVARYWEIRVSEAVILEQEPPTIKQGYCLAELRAIAEKFDLDAFMLSMNSYPQTKLTEQIQNGRPVICAIEYPKSMYIGKNLPVWEPLYQSMVWNLNSTQSHFVVAFGISEKQVLIMDPSFGYAEFSWDRFLECWKKKEYGALICVRKANIPQS